MTTILSTRGREALDRHYTNIGQVNSVANVHRQFNVDPTVEQRLEDLQTESVEFLNSINIYGVRDLKGQTIGMGAAKNMIATRTSEANLPRKPKYVGRNQAKIFELFDTEFDTKLPWNLIDHWSKFPDFAVRYSRYVAQAIGLSRITIGWHGETAEDDSDPVANPNGEDMNIGWLQKLRLERPDHVMGRAIVGGTATGAAVPVLVGAGQAYQNIDALAYDLIAGMPSWARISTELSVVVSADLVDEKYFPMVNRRLAETIDGGKSTSDEVVGTIVKSQKQIGGRPAVMVPFFPEGTMLITPTKNLSIYYQEGSRRRYIKDEPENKAGLVDYNSVNEGYVIEDTDFAVMAENITFEAAEPEEP